MPLDNDDLKDIQREVKGFGDDFKALRDSMQKDLAEVRTLAEDAKKAGSSENPEVKRTIDALSASVTEKHSAVETALKEQKERADKLETMLGRLPTNGTDDKEQALIAKHAVEFYQAKASAAGQLNVSNPLSVDNVDHAGYKSWADSFGLYLRRDDRAVEAKALSAGSNPDGGYLVPTARSSRIIQKIYETSPLRQFATVENIGTSELEIPIDMDEAGAGWVGEEQARPETSTPTIGVQKIVVHEMYAKPKATQKLLEDAAVDVEGWLSRKVAEKFARIEATAFMVGDGINKPRGLLTYPAGTGRGKIPQIASGDANLLTADAIVSFPFQLKSEYAANARWLLKRSSVAAAMLFKGSDGQYLWTPSRNAGDPSILGGFPVSMFDDMPAIAAGAIVAAFGDFRRAYTIVDRLGIVTLRDPYSSKPFVEFYTRRRVGGDVVDFDSFVTMKIAAS